MGVRRLILRSHEATTQPGPSPRRVELASDSRKQHEARDEYVPWAQHVRRREQTLLDRIIKGAEVGQYYLLLGPKAVEAEGVAICDAHPDLEVFRLRLGKALNYEFNEDTQTSLFQRRGPREAGPSLDIERESTSAALDKLEKVALRYARRTSRPFILIFANIHSSKTTMAGGRCDNIRKAGRLQLGILTMVFSRHAQAQKPVGFRSLVTVSDLTFKNALRASAQMCLNAKIPTDAEDLHDAVFVHMLAVEKAWLLILVGLIPDCDDDVVDEQKWSSCSWLLLREFVKQRREDERKRTKALASDSLEDLDRANVFAVDAAREVVEEEGFDNLLDRVRS
ncbi:uncharacterized protein C8Q71DRAFT_849467 [Rhodofomes roseus]|uniref:AAA protein C-terminal winged helix domain-containing protein n=1 Tax=Rhodofomes roseus TaxID=34475 RepID=A0ABQ8KAQ6_9APHY|nr:uncharacterized protein C8Q71DRAFT_849467 [Rhodofomes roseus]KAH9834020.1 hypothetical protein C8Q71DRAFT_849467 [Rhodofomes roseus]